MEKDMKKISALKKIVPVLVSFKDPDDLEKWLDRVSAKLSVGKEVLKEIINLNKNQYGNKRTNQKANTGTKG